MGSDFFDLPEEKKLEGMLKLKDWIDQGKRLAELQNVSEAELMEKFERAQQFYMAKKWEKAAMVCCQIIMLDHKNDQYWELFGLCMVRLGSYPIAKMAFVKAMELNIRNAVYAFYLAQVIELDEGLEKALPSYQMAMELCHHTEDLLGVKQAILQKLKDRVK